VENAEQASPGSLREMTNSGDTIPNSSLTTKYGSGGSDSNFLFPPDTQAKATDRLLEGAGVLSEPRAA